MERLECQTTNMLTLTSLDQLKDHTGQEIGVSGWFAVTQERIQKFADATLDHQWIHIDQERAKRESPFNTTISHGFLTLSLLPQFVPQVLKIDGDQLRFEPPAFCVAGKVRVEDPGALYFAVGEGCAAGGR